MHPVSHSKRVVAGGIKTANQLTLKQGERPVLPPGPNVTTRVFKRRTRREGQDQRERWLASWEGMDPSLLALETGWALSLCKPIKARKGILCRASRKECRPADTLILSRWELCWTLTSSTVRWWICIVLCHEVCGSLSPGQQETDPVLSEHLWEAKQAFSFSVNTTCCF